MSITRRTSLTDTIALSVPARPDYLALGRLVAASVAARADLDLTSVEEVRLAVDEACTQLIAVALPGSEILCEFRIEPGEVHVTASVDHDGTRHPDQDSIGWHVLASVSTGLAYRLEGARAMLGFRACRDSA
ncbi:ATP-binding protein [Hoyosella sp. G463]|uniref:ATP-binding protein n=1 Tax=Lolliginicoccus lacisalsi TaxID=2742202 RepID=A0A927PMU3_9ACTN|nr:ATP-binding protein [Lolliginicoccus lacisalsi]